MPTLQPFTLLFIAVAGLTLGLELLLVWRQARHVRAHRERVPAAFATVVSAEEHARAADYTRARLQVTAVELLLGFLVLMAWTLGGGLAALDAGIATLGWGPLLSGTAVLIALFGIGALIDLPVSAWRTFGVEARFGFNRTTLRVWLSDLAKGLVLLVLIGAPLIAAALWLFTSAGPGWWLWLWGLWTVFTVTLTWAWPRLIAPLFNRFSPIGDGELRQRLEALLARCGFTSDGLFVMDGSKRSAHGNAYFTGIGDHKRIVLFDTLVERLAPVEVEAVVAHELGHFRLHHIRRRLLVGIVMAGAACALLGWLAAAEWFAPALGVPEAAPHTVLALFLLALPPFTTLFTPWANLRSRRDEFAADAYASAHADGAALARALVSLYRDNASTLTPDPWFVAFHYSHPPAAERIARLPAGTG